jgi:hypothetical protein
MEKAQRIDSCSNRLIFVFSSLTDTAHLRLRLFAKCQVCAAVPDFQTESGYRRTSVRELANDRISLYDKAVGRLVVLPTCGFSSLEHAFVYLLCSDLRQGYAMSVSTASSTNV